MSKLQEIRKSRGLSQSQLAKKSGVGIKIIQSYEQNLRDINKAEALTLYKFSTALECKIEDLLEIEPEEPISFEGLTFKELLGE